MKRIIAIICSIIVPAVLLTACADASDNKKAEGVPTVVNATEYTLYQNIMFNKTGDDYLGDEVTKSGTFTRIYDAFHQRERYYVWGYNDQTKCCDWQWELCIKKADDLPTDGSLVTVQGVFAKNKNALDTYWIENPVITVETAYTYTPEETGVNMLTMNATLERVQLSNIVMQSAQFEGKSVALYGRVASLNSIQHPYYDGAWTQEIESEEPLPAIGTMVIVRGVIENGAFKQCTVEETSDYS